MDTHQTRIRVRYAETDQMGIVYYANYLVWMEVARVEYCRFLGFHYRDMELEDGILLAVVEADCRYLNPARFDEEIVIETSLAEASTRLVQFRYEMTEAVTRRRIARGTTKHMYLSRDLNPVRLPAKYQPLFGIAG